MSPDDSCLIDSLKSFKGRVCVAFSGGVDSSFISWAACRYCEAEALPVFMVSELVPEDDRDWAIKALDGIGCGVMELGWNPLEIDRIRANSPDRCYWCKHFMYSALIRECRSLGSFHLLDGTNADDLKSHRPGLRAIEGLGVQIPLARCGYTKDAVREKSRELGLAAWNRPSQSCLATRIATGINLTRERLHMVDMAEKYLKILGASGKIRVRYMRYGALIQVEDSDKRLLESRWTEIKSGFSGLGFQHVEFKE